MSVDTCPVLGQRSRHATENVRSEVRDLDPARDQKARVIGKEADVLPPGFCRPADEAVTGAKMTRRRRPGQAGNRPIYGVDHIFEMFPYRLHIPKIVVALNEAVEKRLVLSAPDLAELERPDLGQTGTQRRGVYGNLVWFSALDQRVAPDPPNCRQLYVPCPLELQHQPSAHHVSQRPVRLHP